MTAAPTLDNAASNILHDFWMAASFQAHHNTNVVLRGTALLGLACGVVGTFLLFVAGAALFSVLK